MYLRLKRFPAIKAKTKLFGEDQAVVLEALLNGVNTGRLDQMEGRGGNLGFRV